MFLDNYTYPAGCNFIVPIYCIGRNPDIFPDPLKFWPERFDIEKTNEIMNPFAYIPFSAGPRNCIGQKFAMLELKSILSKILRTFSISLADDSFEDPKLIAELILVPENKINFRIKKRIRRETGV